METLRNDWTESEIQGLFETPFNDLLFQAQTTHRQNFNPNQVQLSTLLNIKTGGCSENCAFCPQSAHYDTGVTKQPLMSEKEVTEQARAAKAIGATRFCMGAAWLHPPEKDFPKVVDMIRAVKDLGMETCLTIGTLNTQQATELKEAGLDYYNHNLESSPEFYKTIVTTQRTYEGRLETLKKVHDAGIKMCCGGIVGLGETREDRIKFLQQLVNLPEHPKSVPINRLVPIKGAPLEQVEELDSFEFIRTIAVARILMPKSFVRLSAGRLAMNDEMQALCFFAGANSIHYGEKLLITTNPNVAHDRQLFTRLGLTALE